MHGRILIIQIMNPFYWIGKKMNRSIEEMKDSDLRGVLPALKRAAIEARKIAKETGTAVIYMKDGKIIKEYIK